MTSKISLDSKKVGPIAAVRVCFDKNLIGEDEYSSLCHDLDGGINIEENFALFTRLDVDAGNVGTELALMTMGALQRSSRAKHPEGE